MTTITLSQLAGIRASTTPPLAGYNGGMAKRKDPAAVALGKLRAKTLTPAHQRAAVQWRYADEPRCGCGCGLLYSRAKRRHPARAIEAPPKRAQLEAGRAELTAPAVQTEAAAEGVTQ